jgi:hypothetical protein
MSTTLATTLCAVVATAAGGLRADRDHGRRARTLELLEQR